MTVETLVSVAMITYGHEKFVEEAIESVLAQQCSFDIELIICNDKSPDESHSVIERIIGQHPKGSLIKYIVRKNNIGIVPNFIDCLERCSGKYIALCEGDDYWLDTSKLQKQVDYLEANPGYSMCFHNALVESGKEKTRFNAFSEDADFSALDLTQSNFIATASVVFRRENIIGSIEVLRNLPVGDWGLHLLNAKKGKIRFLNTCMSVYRHHEGGAWSSLKSQDRVFQGIEVMKKLDAAFDYEFHSYFEMGIRRRLKKLSIRRRWLTVLRRFFKKQ